MIPWIYVLSILCSQCSKRNIKEMLEGIKMVDVVNKNDIVNGY
jgi:hypothetical protein